MISAVRWNNRSSALGTIEAMRWSDSNPNSDITQRTSRSERLNLARRFNAGNAYNQCPRRVATPEFTRAFDGGLRKRFSSHRRL